MQLGCYLEAIERGSFLGFRWGFELDIAEAPSIVEFKRREADVDDFTAILKKLALDLELAFRGEKKKKKPLLTSLNTLRIYASSAVGGKLLQNIVEPVPTCTSMV
jgi:hypothetical protein